MLLYMIYVILCHFDQFLGMFDFLFSIFFDLVCWYAVRFRAEGLSGSSLSIRMDRGKLAKDFVVAGTASESLYGACESMFKPDMDHEELFETISQALISSVDRDCLSGWGGHVYIVTPTEVTERILKGRMD
ncbi:putative proteasome endopeptidase complex [Helianthus annuus]|nr:putative proteasome endopeptidase complex [Helianthus annuus]